MDREALRDEMHYPMWIEEVIGTRELSLEEWQEIGRIIQVESERPKGDWVDRDGWSYCSNCGEEATPQNNGCEIEPCRAPFCQWCGADMRGDKE